jgi:hypothetical protein
VWISMVAAKRILLNPLLYVLVFNDFTLNQIHRRTISKSVIALLSNVN